MNEETNRTSISSSPVPISEKQFMRQYEIAKRYVDMGIEDYFILLDNDAFANVSEIGNTTLEDISSVFGKDFSVFFRFGGFFDSGTGPNDRENYQTFEIRPISKHDIKKLRGNIRFFPKDCWVCDWRDGKRFNLLLPFIQTPAGDIKFLQANPVYVPRGRGLLRGDTAPERYLKHVIEILPDYYDALFAVVKYKHTDIAIPIEKNSAKKTFRNREKDADGVKRHLIHNVKEHERATLKNKDSVRSHMKGRSCFTLNGIDVSLMASFEWSKRAFRDEGMKIGDRDEVSR